MIIEDLASFWKSDKLYEDLENGNCAHKRGYYRNGNRAHRRRYYRNGKLDAHDDSMLDFGAHDDHREHFRAQCREDIVGMQSPSEETSRSKRLPGQHDKLSCKDSIEENSKCEGHVDMKDCCPKQDPGLGQSRSPSKRKLKPCGYCS